MDTHIRDFLGIDRKLVCCVRTFCSKHIQVMDMRKRTESKSVHFRHSIPLNPWRFPIHLLKHSGRAIISAPLLAAVSMFSSAIFRLAFLSSPTVNLRDNIYATLQHAVSMAKMQNPLAHGKAKLISLCRSREMPTSIHTEVSKANSARASSEISCFIEVWGHLTKTNQKGFGKYKKYK